MDAADRLTFVAKLDKNNEVMQVTSAPSMIGLSHCGRRWATNCSRRPSLYWIANVTVPMALTEASEAFSNGGWLRYHSWKTP
jgi:hypothetical protein